MINIFSIACLVVALFSTNPSQLTGDPTQIIITPPGTPLPNRGADPVPVSGCVDGSLDIVYLQFSGSNGSVDISFENLDNGTFTEVSVNGSGLVAIPLSCSAGTWEVIFSFPSGEVYQGYFVL